ncbi:MAG: hypothetical protein JOS17DRAFT_734521 [Linnemannia elongata]|nr:MAG: hypothetical protein JOS17DRAFT_734521 [Linnemannia elongata]
MVNEYQSFRRGPTGGLMYLEVFDEPESNQQVIYWDDITAVFPTARHVKNGPAIVSFVRNKQRQWCEPRCIRHYPGDVLEVVEVGPSSGSPQSPSTPEPTNPFITTSSLPVTKPSHAFSAHPSTSDQAIASAKSFGQKSTDPHLNAESLVIQGTIGASVTSPATAVVAATSPASHRLLQRAQSLLQESSAQLARYERSVQAGEVAQADAIMYGMQRMHQDLRGGILALHSEVTKNKEMQQRILDMLTEADTLARRMEEKQKHSIELQERSIKMQQEVLKGIALMQNKVAAILTQTYELHEYPIPRLFIVLPKESTSRSETLGRGIKNLFADQFTLYFLCECGEHTKPVDGQPTNPSLKHEIHIARHEGYDIDRPNEFFDKYGLYILALLQMLKYGVTIAGVVVPPLGQLNIVDVMEGTHCGINTVLQDLGSKVDSSIAYIESLTGAQSQLVASDSSSSSAGLGGLEALEGADLRHLESFLKTSDKGRVLGNLYRIVTSDGHVKWVCLDHYRENYRAKAAQDLRDAIQGVAGRYDESTGRASVDLSSPTAARIFYAALASSRSVQSLEVRFEWSLSLQDLRDLRDAIKSTNVIEVTIKKLASGSPLSDVFNNGRRSDPLLQMLSGGKIQSFRLYGWDIEFLDRISTIPATLTVRKLLIGYEQNRQKRIPRLISILQASPLLSEIRLEEVDIDEFADHFLPALERAKLPRTFEVVIGSDDYSRASFKVEAHTGRVWSIDVRYRNGYRTEFLYHPSVRHVHFVKRERLPSILDELWHCLRNNTNLESVKVDCSSDDFIDWLQSFHRVFTNYPQQTSRLIFEDEKSTLITSNIQDLSTTVIHLESLSNKRLSAGYLGTVQDDWTFTVDMLVLATNTTPTDITILAQLLQPRPDRLSFPALEVTIDSGSDLTIVPPLIRLLEECQALQDTRIRLDLNYAGTTLLFTDISSQDAAQHLTQLF